MKTLLILLLSTTLIACNDDKPTGGPVHNVPDGGSTAALFGLVVIGIMFGRKYWMIPLLALAVPASGADRIAASASLQDVQTAVNAASDGDRVLIPNGSAAWGGGIATSKQIIIRAQNYTPTPAGTLGAGASNRNVVITNNSSVPLLSFTTGNAFNSGVGGIRFNEGSGLSNHVRFNGQGSKVGLLFDCFFQNKQRNGNSTDVAAVCFLGTGGVMWNCIQSADGYTGGAGVSPFGVDGSSLVIKSSRAWETPSTMGTLDTNGTVNVYVEACSFLNLGGVPDCDVGGRVVFRRCNYDGTFGVTHGFTPAPVGRHTEHYDNVFQVSQVRNIAARYYWNRGGTALFTGNTVNTPVNTSSWGNANELDIGDSHQSPSAYPVPRQPGGGHDGSKYVVDPIYIWGESGPRAYTVTYRNNWGSVVQPGRDIFVNAGAKPGWQRYTYPHPQRAAVEGGPQPTPTPTPVPTPPPTPTPTPVPTPTPAPTPTPPLEPTPHTHTISEIQGLQETLDGKTNQGHEHNIPASKTE